MHGCFYMQYPISPPWGRKHRREEKFVFHYTTTSKMVGRQLFIRIVSYCCSIPACSPGALRAQHYAQLRIMSSCLFQDNRAVFSYSTVRKNPAKSLLSLHSFCRWKREVGLCWCSSQEVLHADRTFWSLVRSNEMLYFNKVVKQMCNATLILTGLPQPCALHTSEPLDQKAERYCPRSLERQPRSF